MSQAAWSRISTTDVPCGTGREPSRWHGFFGMGNIHRVRISGDGYSYDDLRLPVPVAPGDPRACQ